MPTSLNLATRRDANASVTTIHNGNRVAVAAFANSLIAGASPLALALAGLSAALATLGDQAGPLVPRLQYPALIEEIRALVARIVAPAYQNARDAVQSSNRAYAARLAVNSEPPASLPFLSSDIADFRALDLGDQAAWIARGDRSQSAALIVAGQSRFPDLPGTIWDQVIERHAVLAHIERSGFQANFQLVPTPDNPAAIGLDSVAAENAAREAFRQFRDERHQIDDAEAVLRSVIVAVAVATDLTVDGAFALLNGEGPE